MTIGIVVTAGRNSGGIYQYAHSILDALYSRSGADEYIVFVPAGADFRFERYEGVRIEVMDPLLMQRGDIQAYLSADGLDLKEAGVNRRGKEYFEGFGINLLIYPAPCDLSFECGVPYVMAIHDLQHRLHPEFPEVSAGNAWKAREYTFRNGVRYAEGILVDSEVGKEDVLNFYGDYIKAEQVLPLPFLPFYKTGGPVDEVQIAGVRAKYNLLERFLFYPAQFWLHKNHFRLIHAIHLLRFVHKIDCPLVLVGSNNGGSKEEGRELVFKRCMELADKWRVRDLVKYLGYVSDEDMAALYAGAQALVMPTFFGPTNIPVLEAWSFGCPVISSDIRGIREQIGDAGLLANPEDSGAIAECIFKLWTNEKLRGSLTEAGYKKVNSYGPGDFAKRLYAAIDGVQKRISSKKHVEIPKKGLQGGDGYLVSAIVSTYNSQRFMRGCLEDLVGQTLFKKGLLEIVVVDSGSQEGEGGIVKEFAAQYGHIKYIRTEERESVYAAWNRGIRASCGRYITNSNTDDRHRADTLELMARALEEHPEVGLVNADVLVTYGENETFESNTAQGYFAYPEFSLRQALVDNVFGPQPMWRKSVHEMIGYCDPKYTVAGDYEFFLRVACKSGAIHLREVCGLYLSSRGVEAKNQQLSAEESFEVLRQYRSTITLEDIYPGLVGSGDSGARIAALVDFANSIMSGPYPDYALAKEYFRQALEVAPEAGAVMNNLAVCLYCLGRKSESIELFTSAAQKGFEVANQNLNQISCVGSGGANLTLATVKHPVVEALPTLKMGGVYVRCDKIDKHNVPVGQGIELGGTAKPKLKIGIAVLAHERAEYLKICLDTLFETNLYDYDVTFLLQDDGSSDARVGELMEQRRNEKYKIVRYFTAKGHNSWGAAFNKAMKKLLAIDKFDIVGSCDSDALFHPQWLDKMLKVCVWARKNHRGHVLGPFSSFNSSDYKFHKILGTYESPYGSYVVKERMGALNYFYFTEDFLKLGFFPEDKNDETLMTERFKQLGVCNFCTETSYVEHVGQLSVLNQWRPSAVECAVYGMNLAKEGWPEVLSEVGTMGYFRHVHHNTSLEAARRSQMKIDILIPVAAKDVEVLGMVIDSARENLRHPIGRVIVVGEDSQRIKSVCSAKMCEFVDEATVLAIRKEDIDYKVKDMDRAGWLFQQLVKFSGDSICSEEHYLTLDADTVLIKPAVFEVDGKIVMLHSDEHHQPYFDLYRRLFGAQTHTALSFVSHHMLFSRELLGLLKQQLQMRHGAGWMEALFKNIDGSQLSGMSEYEIYGQWVFANHPERVVRECWFNMSVERAFYWRLAELKSKLSGNYRSISFHEYQSPSQVEETVNYAKVP